MNARTAAAAAVLLAAHAAPAQTYRVADLGSLGGDTYGLALGPEGQAAGYSSLPAPDNNHRAFLFTNNNLNALPVPQGATQTVAFAFGGNQAVYGIAYSFNSLDIHAIAWQNNTPVDLGTFILRGANPSGDLAGTADVAVDGLRFTHAVAYRRGQLIDLGTLGGLFSTAHDIDPDGRVVGSSTLPGNAQHTRHAALWLTDGRIIDLGTLGGTSSHANAIAPGGWIVGVSDTPSGHPHAMRLRVDNDGNVIERLDLGVLTGRDATANDVNQLGHVVGTSNARAFLYRGSVLIDLNSLIPQNSGWTLESAAAIDDQGRITGRGLNPSGFPAAFLLTPTPDCPADLNGDGAVDGADFLAFLSYFFQCDPRADFNNDGLIDGADFLGFLQAFFEGC